jgi:glucuronosyltransferase
MQFKDRLMPPLEEAVYWVEHTLRHDVDFLKTTATELTWYQYLLLDVILTFTFIIVCLFWLIFLAARCLIRALLCLLSPVTKRERDISDKKVK